MMSRRRSAKTERKIVGRRRTCDRRWDPKITGAASTAGADTVFDHDR